MWHLHATVGPELITADDSITGVREGYEKCAAPFPVAMGEYFLGVFALIAMPCEFVGGNFPSSLLARYFDKEVSLLSDTEWR